MRIRSVIIALSTCILSAGVALSAHAVSLDESAVLYMPFEEGDGDVAEDLSGNGNDGELIGPIERVAGQVGEALRFNGTDTYVEIPSNDTLQAMDDGWTIALWVKVTPASGAWARFVDKFFGTGYIVGRRNVDLVAGAEWAGSPNAFATETAVFDDEWHHFVYTRAIEGGQNVHRLYLDGQLENEGGGGVLMQQNQNTTPVRIGAGDECCEEGGAVAYHIDGVLDEVLIYRKTLSEAEVAALFREGIQLAVEPHAKLATQWARLKARR